MVVKVHPERLIRASKNGRLNAVQSFCEPLKLIQIPQEILDQAVFAAMQSTLPSSNNKPQTIENCWQIIDCLCHVSYDGHQVSEECLNKVLMAAVSAERIDMVRGFINLPPHHFPNLEVIHRILQDVIDSNLTSKWELIVCLCRLGVSEEMRTLAFIELAQADQWHAIDKLYVAGLRPQQIGIDYMLHKASKDKQWDIFQQICSLQEPSSQAANRLLKAAVRAQQNSVIYQLCKLDASNSPDPITITEAINIAHNTRQPVIAYYLKAHLIAASSPNALTAIFTLLQNYLKKENHLITFFNTEQEAINHLKEIVATLPKEKGDEEDESIISDIIFSLKNSSFYTKDLQFISLVNYIVEQYTDDYYSFTNTKYPLQ